MQSTDIEWKLRNAVRSQSRWIVVHSSLFHLRIHPNKLSEFKWAFLKAIRTLSKEGYTFAFPSFTFSFTKSGIFHSRLPSEVGVLADWVLELQESRRTLHPIYSHVVMGNEIDLAFACSTKTCFGDNGIYELFCAQNATIMMLGCDWSYCTSFHMFEERYSVPYRYHKSFRSVDGTIETTMFVRSEHFRVKNDFSSWIRNVINDEKVARDDFIGGNLQSIDFSSLASQCQEDLSRDVYCYTKDPEILKYEISCKHRKDSSDELKVALLFESNYEPLVDALQKVTAELLPHIDMTIYANDYAQMAADIVSGKVADFRPDFCLLPSRLEDILHVSNLDFADLSSVNIVDQYIDLIKNLSTQVSRLLFVNLFSVHPTAINAGTISIDRSHITQKLDAINQYFIESLSALSNVCLIPVEGLDLNNQLDSRLWYLGRVPYAQAGFSKLAHHYSGLLAHELGFSTRLNCF